jgi:hypothetical protein
MFAQTASQKSQLALTTEQQLREREKKKCNSTTPEEEV